MSERTARLILAFLALFVFAQLALLVRLWYQVRSATVEVRATNAGIPVPPAETRVWVHVADDEGRIVAEGASAEALPVPAGTYNIRVADLQARDGHVAWLRDVAVEEGAQVRREVALSAGELQVDAEDGGPAEGAVALVVYVFRRGDHDTIVTTMPAGTPVRLGAGAYDIRVVLTISSEERSTVWLDDVPVETGRRTSRSVAFRRGTLLVTAYNGGEALPPSAVTLTVIRAGDVQEEEVERGVAGMPLGLPSGRYDVKATFAGSNDRPTRWLRNIAIAERETAEHRVDFTSGIARVRALAGERELHRFDAYAYFYPIGDHRRAITYAPAGDPVLLTAGRYDVRVQYVRADDQPDAWRYDLRIEPGGTTSADVAFDSGRLLVRVFDGNDDELVGDDVFVYVHAAGERSHAIVTARSGQILVLRAGRYDVRAVDTRQPDRSTWSRGIVVESGRLVEEVVRVR